MRTIWFKLRVRRRLEVGDDVGAAVVEVVQVLARDDLAAVGRRAVGDDGGVVGDLRRGTR
jgi:hypothetical protein